jgi:hypothetical protein
MVVAFPSEKCVPAVVVVVVSCLTEGISWALLLDRSITASAVA